MGLADDMAKFRAQTAQERQESFEESTLSLVLLQLGWTRPQVRVFQRDLDVGYGWDWFNNECSDLHLTVGSVRIPEFNFEHLWERPARHPITEAWREFYRDKLDADAGQGALIFRCFGLGRLVATNLTVDPGAKTFINVALTSGEPYRVLPFTDFFTPWKEARDDQS